MQPMLGKRNNVTTERITGTGAVTVVSTQVFNITVESTDNEFQIKLTDDTAGSGTVIWGVEGGYQRHFTFDPPLEFDTGVWVESFSKLNAFSISHHPITT